MKVGDSRRAASAKDGTHASAPRSPRIFHHEGLAQSRDPGRQRRRHRRPHRLRGRLHRRDHHRHRGARRRCPSSPSIRRRSDEDLPSTTARSPARKASSSPPARSGSASSARPAPTSPCASPTPTIAGHLRRQARGEMQIAILVEQMRREGFEVLVSRPEVIYQRDDDGNLLEPIENALRRSPERKPRRHPAEPRRPQGRDHQHGAPRRTASPSQAVVPTRGLIGFETDLVNCHQGPRRHEPPLPRIRPGPGRDRRRATTASLVGMEGGDQPPPTRST